MHLGGPLAVTVRDTARCVAPIGALVDPPTVPLIDMSVATRRAVLVLLALLALLAHPRGRDFCSIRSNHGYLSLSCIARTRCTSITWFFDGMIRVLSHEQRFIVEK
jgi:hypothetical protein